MKKDSTTALLKAMRDIFEGFEFTLDEVKSRSWASATFTGARHELTFRIAGEGAASAADDFLANLEAREFTLRGHIMADIALVSEERRDGENDVRISLEALTVEDA